MWTSVLLDDQLALAILKSAIATGHAKLIDPQTESERQQLKAILTQVNRVRSERAALTYALLADNVFLDPTYFGWEVFANLDSNHDCSSRPLIESTSPDFAAVVKPTESGLNYIRTGAFADPQERANLFASLEPLIWRSFTRAKTDLNRRALRDALDLIVLEPMLIDWHKELESEKFDSAVRDTALDNWPHLRLKHDQLRYLRSVCYVAITKGHVAANKVEEARRLNAVYPVSELTFGSNRYRRHHEHFPAARSQDIVVAAGIFLEEVQYWPVLNDISDVLRMREHKHFVEFRDILRQWVTALCGGNIEAEKQIREEIRRANAALRTAATCSEIGRFFAYLGLPLLVLDGLVAPVIGTPITVAGFGLQAYADWKIRKGRWLIIGK